MNEDQPDLGERIVGWMLMAGGVLIALLSGACTLTFLIQPGELSPATLLALTIFGGLPFVAGVGITIVGRKLVQPRRRAPSSTSHDGAD